jgi:phosphohistidine phosphatase SixA
VPRLLLVRHAQAGARGQGRRDLERELDDRGRAQAEALRALLLTLLIGAGARGSAGASEPVEVEVRSSPARRCVDTVAPLAAALGTPVLLDEALVEGADAGPLSARIGELATPTVWSSHGDVIPELLMILGRRGVDLGDAPRCQKGSTWVLEVIGGEVTAARYLAPPA